MAITFYEGLPGHFKSYSAMRDEVIPALAKGRKVVAYVEGLDHEKIAALAGITLDQCRELLVQIPREDVPKIYENVTKDALYVIDEVQNFWPSTRGALPPEITQFVTEHRHDGLDIVLMGQDCRDVHPLWRRRIELKIFFQNKAAIGKPMSYSATMQRATLKGKEVVFENMTSISYEADPKYFGTYKSHTAETTNKETRVDDRSIVWNMPLFRRWLPMAGAVALFAVWYLWDFFHGGLEKDLTKDKPALSAAARPPAPPAPPQVQAQQVIHQAPPAPAEPPDIIQELTSKYRPRFLGFIRAGSRQDGWIEWRDSSTSVYQRLSFLDLSGLGWSVMTNPQGSLAILTKGAARIVVTAWPVDRSEGRASESQQERLRRDNGPAPASRGGPSGASPAPQAIALAPASP